MKENQAELPFEGRDPSELTDWFDGRPPHEGWWNVRHKDAPEEVARRYFFKASGRYSFPVRLGCSDEHCHASRSLLSRYEPEDGFQFQGLKDPPPSPKKPRIRAD